ncbi:MAG: alpha/beta fold hydrolase [Candidatus Izemoplasmataceae bacterium]
MDKKTVELYHGETLAYSEHGDTSNATLVLLHGNMSSGVHFEPLIPALEKHFHLLIPDLRGFGDSSYERPIDSLEDFADDVKAFLEALKIPKAHLAGWSTGGGIALKFAAKYAHVAHKVVLIESASHRGYPIPKKDSEGNVMPSEFYVRKEDMAEDPVQVAPLKRALEENNRDFIKMVWDQTIYNVKKPEEEAFERFIDETMKQRNLVDVDWALMNFNMSNTPNGVAPGDGTIEDVEAPVLAIHGEKDLVIPETMFNELTDALKDVRVKTFKNAGHSPVTDIPGPLSETIIAFLES